MNAKKYTVGMPLSAASATLESQTTRPPEHYTENTLMDDMLAAYKFATNESDRELLKQISGIGTSRTRGVIIKGFVDRGFLVRSKKAKLYQLRIAPEGRALLAGLPDAIKDVTLTAKWERALEMVAAGTAKPEQLRAKVNSMLHELIGKLLPATAIKV
ncbi:DNA topoisomerase [Polaromonas sp.]|uniref:DNA topoisomerase n=1 Tax=Polaromonas sp. TaxID=1869339 RepID=UPI00352AA6EC